MYNQQKLPEISLEERSNMRTLLEQCRNAFEDRNDFFEDRRRSFRFYIGNQWGDTMELPNGKRMTEEEYIRSEGRMPAQNNQIGTVVRNLIGQFRNNYPDPVAFGRSREKSQAGEIMTAALQRAIDINQGDELDARNFEELLVSAAVGWKVSFQWWNELDMNDVYIENIDQTRFFYNIDSNDIRNKDVWLCGEIHDMRMDDILSNFAKDRRDVERIRKMFPNDVSSHEYQTNRYPDYLKTHRNFYYADEPDLNRVIEAWRLEHQWNEFVHDSKDGTYTRATPEYFAELGFSPQEIELYETPELVYFYNQERTEIAAEQNVDPAAVPMLDLDVKYEGVWRVYYLTPLGDVLFESDTPYAHDDNPYVFGMYPMMDGKLRSVVESIIDQQKYINRLISLMDTSLSNSIKNLKLVPESLLPDDMTREQFAQQSVELNGYIFYDDSKGGAHSKMDIVKDNSRIAGAQELLSLQMNLLQEISAVNDAVQGQRPPAGTPASLYAQQAANASISNKDIYDFYFGLLRKRNRKVIQVMQDFYTEKRYVKIAGSGLKQGVSQMYDPDKVQGVDFDVVLGETQNTLAYRQLVDNYLKQFLDEQRITFEEYLKHTSLPFADQLMQTISNRMDGAQNAGGIPPELQQQIAQGNITPEIAQQLGLDNNKNNMQGGQPQQIQERMN